MAVRGAHVEFTPETTRRVLVEACAVVGLDPSGAELLRLGENALFALDTVVVRIARAGSDDQRVRTEMRVARWLASEDVPAARLAVVEDEPIAVEGHPVTFWERIREGGEPPTRTDLARLLRRLHALEVPTWLDLPSFDPFRRMPERLSRPWPGVAEEDQAFLRERLAQLRGDLAGVKFPTAPCAVHGDAHPGNLMRTHAGQVLLIDFEAFCHGPREWDLVPTAMYRHGFARLDEHEYRAFVGEYGYDVSTWSGFPVLRSIREMGMTTWLMQLAGHDLAARSEFEKRVSQLRSGSYPRQWRPF